ncbi:hypothetical protein ACKLNO_11260 [Neisseriaceae bacterium B1]
MDSLFNDFKNAFRLPRTKNALGRVDIAHHFFNQYEIFWWAVSNLPSFRQPETVLTRPLLPFLC